MKKKRKRTKEDPTGWYNHVVGGSIPPVPTRVVKEKKRGDEKRSEEKKRTKKKREM